MNLTSIEYRGSTAKKIITVMVDAKFNESIGPWKDGEVVPYLEINYFTSTMTSYSLYQGRKVGVKEMKFDIVEHTQDKAKYQEVNESLFEAANGK